MTNGCKGDDHLLIWVHIADWSDAETRPLCGVHEYGPDDITPCGTEGRYARLVPPAVPRHLRPHATFGDDSSGWCGCAECEPRGDCGCPSCRRTLPSGGLTDFLLARIREDEICARQLDHHERLEIDSDVRAEVLKFANSGRVLAECEAKRRIVELHDPVSGHACGPLHDRPCFTLQALGLPYADHPDYREEWKP